MSSEVYVSKVEKVGDEYVILFQREFLDKLALSEDDILTWEFQSKNEILLKKTNTRSQ